MTTMKAMVLEGFGTPGQFSLREVPVPALKPDELLVQVMATSVNPLDYQIGRGDYAEHLPLPAIIGHDVSGVIVQAGAAAHEFAPGEEVYYTPPIFGSAGSYAEYHAVPQALVARKPRGLTHFQAAALTLTGSTAWHALVERAQLQAGETVLVHAGNGGVGSLCIQIAHALGATAYATCRAEQAELVCTLGATEAIDYLTEDYIARMAEFTGGAGVDVVIDTIGGTAIQDAPQVLKPFGRVVSIVDTAQPQNLLAAWGKNMTLHFVFVQQHRAPLEQVARLADAGQLRPLVHSVLPISRVADAHALLARGGLTGKIVLDVAHGFDN
jgi:NADPH:quinone reductase